MDRAIDFITSYVTKCVECRFSKNLSCEFMLLEGQAPSVDNNPYLEDGIMDLSSEGRAFRIQKKRGNPCEDQMDFEKYLRKLEYLLERITVPFMTTDLLRQIGKINRIYSIILRSSDAISCTLGDITMASMEKCLARIDYFYLEQGADILCAINSVTSNYDRMDALLSMYPEVIVKSYINNAVVLQMDHLTSGNHHMTEVISRAREESMEPEADSINEDTSEEDFSFNFVNASGVEEVDRIFKLMIEDNPSYPDEVFNADLKSFRRKCDALANSDEPLEKKEAWVVSVINVIAESYFHFTWDGPTIIGDRLIAFWAVIEAAFLRAPQQICIKHLASELSIDDLVSRVDPETIKRREEDEYVHETNPISITESELYTELGPTIGYNERRICKKCEIEAAILFEEYPDIKEAYSLVHRLRMIYAHTKTKGGALPKLALWYNDVQKTNFKEFKTVAETIQTHYSNILNFFNNRSTNASAESLNSKIKAFRMQLRGVSDVKYFLFRLAKIYA